MTTSGSVKDELRKRGYTEEQTEHLMWRHLSLYMRNREDCSAQQIVDQIELEEKETRNGIIVRAIVVFSILAIIIFLKNFYF